MQMRDTVCQPLALMYDLGTTNCVPFTLDAHRGSVMLLQYMILDHRSNILSLYRLVDIRRVFSLRFLSTCFSNGDMFDHRFVWV